MSVRHLSCPGCRIRVLATAPAVDLLEARCPICEAALAPASSASSVIGFRSFDLAAFSSEPRLPPRAIEDLCAEAAHRKPIGFTEVETPRAP